MVEEEITANNERPFSNLQISYIKQLAHTGPRAGIIKFDLQIANGALFALLVESFVT